MNNLHNLIPPRNWPGEQQETAVARHPCRRHHHHRCRQPKESRRQPRTLLLHHGLLKPSKFGLQIVIMKKDCEPRSRAFFFSPLLVTGTSESSPDLRLMLRPRLALILSRVFHQLWRHSRVKTGHRRIPALRSRVERSQGGQRLQK